MNKYITMIAVLATLLGMAKSTKAQYAHFPEGGTITYEKTVHVKNSIKEYIKSLKEGDMQRTYMQNLVDKVGETAVLKKKLSFQGNESNWEPIKESYDPMVTQLLTIGMLDYQNKAYQNLEKNEAKSFFEIAGSKVNIKDSLLNITWKITNEYREIAGYECRRANGLTLDSVYVVAFYTDQIPTSSGPSMMHGLPGMILGLVVPEQHFNIYATSVDMQTPTIVQEIAGKRDTPSTRAEVAANLRQSLGNFMDEAQINLLLAAMLL